MLNKWLKNWLTVLYLLGILSFIVLIFSGGNWPLTQRLLWAVAIILPAHACEEWQLPGGFHYQYNLVQGSKSPNRYPMNQLTDMLTVCIAEIVYLVASCWYQVPAVSLSLAGFCLLEVGMHTFFGFKMYRRFKVSGKRTLYNPGLLTAYCGFGPVAIGLILQIPTAAFAIWQLWGETFGLLALMALGEIYLPELIFRNPQTQYGFISAKYFNKFL